MSHLIEKPWGSEEILFTDNRVTVKILRTEKPLSIQIHPLKDEQFIILDFNKDILPLPYISLKNPTSFEDCIDTENGFEKIITGIGFHVDCPRGTVHYIPGGLTILEYSRGEQITLRVKDFYGRGEDTELIRELFKN